MGALSARRTGALTGISDFFFRRPGLLTLVLLLPLFFVYSGLHTEFRLLACLLRDQGSVLTRAELLERVWGRGYTGQPQVVETYVSYLRRKLDRLGPPLIHTRRGVGYMLRGPALAEGGGDDERGAPAQEEDARVAGGVEAGVGVTPQP